MKLKLDLHDIYNRGTDIERALQSIMDEAVAKKAPLVEIRKGARTMPTAIIRPTARVRRMKSFRRRLDTAQAGSLAICPTIFG